MTKHHRQDLIRQLKSRESYAVDSLRRSRRSTDPVNIRLFRENAALLNESAGLAAAELGCASLISDNFRPDDERNALAPALAPARAPARAPALVPDHVADFLRGFESDHALRSHAPTLHA